MVVEFVSMITDLYSIDIKLVRMSLSEPTDHFYDKSVGTVAVKNTLPFSLSVYLFVRRATPVPLLSVRSVPWYRTGTSNLVATFTSCFGTSWTGPLYRHL